jgi:superfamily II RNA helicase
LATRSYWAQQQGAIRKQLDQEIIGLTENVNKIEISSVDVDLILQKDALDLEIANTVNAKRKKAEAALRKWTSEHTIRAGLLDLFRSRQRITGEISRLKAMTDAWDSAPLLNLEPLKSCLIEFKFMNPDFSLTRLGISATEVHEGHLILMPLLADSQKLDSMNIEEIPCILAAFLKEGEVEDLTLDQANLRSEVTDILYWLDEIAESCQKIEDGARVTAPNNYWKMSVTWVCIISRWIAGYTLSQIANEFDLFEGNIQRGILKLVNLVEELVSIATLRGDLNTLDRLRHINLVRDELITDSLYLRL